VWRRLLLLPGMETWHMMVGNTTLGNIGMRLMGAKLGKDAFCAGLACTEPDALDVGDYMSRWVPVRLPSTHTSQWRPILEAGG
jgi:hypothetical protein